MFAAFTGGLDGIGLVYACTMLQLYLWPALLVDKMTFFAGVNAQLKKKFDGIPWQPALQAMAAAAGPAIMVALFALIQIRAQAMNMITLAALCAVGVSVLILVLLAILVPICGGAVSDADAAACDAEEIDMVAFSTLPVARTDNATKFARLMRLIKGVGLLVLLLAAAPEDTQLSCASVLARMALMVEAIVSMAQAFGFGDSALAEACSDSTLALSLTPLVGGLAIIDYNMTLGGSMLYVPLMICAVSLAAKVALIMVLHFGCGGGVEAGCSAESYINRIHFTINGALTFGLFGCILTTVWNSYEVIVSQSGLSIQWGDPVMATAVAIAVMAFATQVFELFAPEPIEQEAAEEIEQNGSVAHPEIQMAPPGISAPMKIITSRAPGLILALAAMQIGASQPSSFGFLNDVLSAFSLPFKFAFCPCVLAMKVQITLLLAHVIFNCETEPIPEPILDGSGTLVWEPESQIGRVYVARMRDAALALFLVGLSMGFLAMGVLQWIPIILVLIFIVYPCLPKEGRVNIMEGFGWAGLALQSCTGVIGEKVEAYLAQRRAMADAAAEAAAAKKAAEIMETEADDDHAGNGHSTEKDKAIKKNKGDSGDFKKKQPNPSPKKASGAKPKKKNNK